MAPIAELMVFPFNSCAMTGRLGRSGNVSCACAYQDHSPQASLWDLHPQESAAFARRTLKAGLHDSPVSGGPVQHRLAIGL